ncbi:Uncharacterized protein PPKH_0753 [Pseudomonas putida]|nr:Uncharacterized protein PPKH_0753 [Pseudomonas putida]
MPGRLHPNAHGLIVFSTGLLSMVRKRLGRTPVPNLVLVRSPAMEGIIYPLFR